MSPLASAPAQVMRHVEEQRATSQRVDLDSAGYWFARPRRWRFLLPKPYVDAQDTGPLGVIARPGATLRQPRVRDELPDNRPEPPRTSAHGSEHIAAGQRPNPAWSQGFDVCFGTKRPWVRIPPPRPRRRPWSEADYGGFRPGPSLVVSPLPSADRQRTPSESVRQPRRRP